MRARWCGASSAASSRARGYAVRGSLPQALQ